MQTTFSPNTVRIGGIAGPAYLNGRSRELLTTAFAPAPKLSPVRPMPILVDEIRKAGARLGEGVPFAAMYMTRSSKKAYALQLAA